MAMPEIEDQALEFERMVERHRRETERSRLPPHDPHSLWLLGRKDNTAYTFLNGWLAGRFPSFESMLLHLVIQLAMEKEELAKTATKAIQVNPGPPMTMLMEEFNAVILESARGLLRNPELTGNDIIEWSTAGIENTNPDLMIVELSSPRNVKILVARVADKCFQKPLATEAAQ